MAGGRYDVYHDPDNSKANFLRLYGNCYSYLPPGELKLMGVSVGFQRVLKIQWGLQGVSIGS